jgi:hypothetical protein
MDFIHLWCGQVGEIDPLRYDKDHVYVTKQCLIAEKWLNIITNPSEK